MIHCNDAYTFFIHITRYTLKIMFVKVVADKDFHENRFWLTRSVIQYIYSNFEVIVAIDHAPQTRSAMMNQKSQRLLSFSVLTFYHALQNRLIGFLSFSWKWEMGPQSWLRVGICEILACWRRVWGVLICWNSLKLRITEFIVKSYEFLARLWWLPPRLERPSRPLLVSSPAAHALIIELVHSINITISYF